MARSATKRKRSIAVGLVVVLLFAGSVVVAVTSQHGLPWASRTVVRAAFDEVGSLREGDDVRIANVRVGFVDDITYEDGRAVAELHFDEERPIYRNAQAVAASVGARSTLGQKYVDFSPGDPSAGELSNGEVVPMTRTVGAQELSDLLDVLDEPTREALGSTVREAGGGVAGHSGDLRDTLQAAPEMLPDLGTVAAALSAEDGADTTRMLRALDGLAGRFAGRQEQIAELVDQLGTSLDAVAVDDGEPLARTLDEAPEALRKVGGTLDRLRQPLADTAAAMRDLGPGARALGKATPDVRGVLTEAPTPLRKVPGVADQAAPAVDELSTAFTSAQPLAPDLTKALRHARTPLEVLAPYSPEASMLFTYGADALADGDAAGNWLRIYTLFNTESVSGALRGVEDPLTARNAYPAPGQAPHDRKQELTAEGGR